MVGKVKNIFHFSHFFFTSSTKKKFPHQKCFLLPLPKNYHYFLWEKWKEIFFFTSPTIFYFHPQKISFGRSTFLTKKSFFYLLYLKIIIFWWGKWKKDFFSNRIPKNYYFLGKWKKISLREKKILGASEIFFSLPLPNK